MEFQRFDIEGPVLIKPDVFGDSRGFFKETYSESKFKENDINLPWVQDNHSRSTRGVLRGLHYQVGKVQAKLVRVVRGAIQDVAVDLRRSSATFAQWFAVELSESNGRQLWVPEGFAHGFVVLSEEVDLLYKTTDYYCPECERTIVWDDPELAIDWMLDHGAVPNLSDKDRLGTRFKDSECFS